MRNYQETLDYLFKQLPIFQREGKRAYKKDLGNIRALCSILNEPQNSIKSIHIAGTNGKGSTAHMLASVFQEAGYKTGLYTSPHLKDFRERIRINGKMIEENEVVGFVERYQEKFNTIRPSFFEWTVALAFDHFGTQKVDIAIIETGLGGRLDSTNILSPELSVITNVSFDHIDVLGGTLDKIAFEKAGIIKSETPVIIGNDSGQAEIFIQKAAQEKAPIHFSQHQPIVEGLSTDLKGAYQKENLQTVYWAWRQLRSMGWRISYPQLLKGLKSVVINTALRGRWEILSTAPYTVADIAHNENGLKGSVRQINSIPKKTLHLVIGFVNDKNFEELFYLFPKDAHYYLTQANIPRALPLKELTELAKKRGVTFTSYESVKKAYEEAQSTANKEDMIYIGGSTFVVAEAL
ncbi:MAG: tetrahydrofolate synthase [Verrucomicrobia bacterium]|nr:tetrahydrofolate synthase [Verrucomicrobiota bacterium]